MQKNGQVFFYGFSRLAGVNTLEFNPLRSLAMTGEKSIFRRTHRKLLIVDGSIAFTGGINIGRIYLKSRRFDDMVSPPEDFWRDTDLMVEGPAVGEIQKLFMAIWKSSGGPALSEGNYFPEPTQKGAYNMQKSLPAPMARSTGQPISCI